MVSFLLPVIYLAFISLGLPDSLLGAAWPVMYPELGTSVSYAGILSMIIAAGTIVSSLQSDRLNTRFGTGKITAFSVLTTAVALFGFSISHSFPALCLFAIPYGLGAGSVDAALNNYVALHYKARHMSWLHCMWGVGCSIGPIVMSFAITNSSWNMGYRMISIFQIILTILLFLSLPLWQKNRESSENGSEVPKNRGFFQLIRISGVKEVLTCFFCYCALETTAGMWAASYCTLYRGIDANRAASWASMFYIGITIGRFFCGFITMKLSDQNMIRLGQIVMGVGILLILLPLPDTLLFAGLILVGLGCAPIYPSIIHETPANFGADLSQGIIGMQMAFAYVGSCLMPPLFGVLGQSVTFGLYPVFMALILLLMVVMSERMHKATAEHRKAYQAA
ncbi:MAG: MFS transporter [Lachnospiraceae bacterium]|nr:MFS transporter [Lachnospiraceae bacterium]